VRIPHATPIRAENALATAQHNACLLRNFDAATTIYALDLYTMRHSLQFSQVSDDSGRETAIIPININCL
jgi:hypothetical protein